jgi:uncharacterized membrane protein YjfL (UPF0719 family)
MPLAAQVLQATPVQEAAPLWRLILDAALFGITGIVLLIIGYYVWELITPYNLRREIHENKNVAVAIVVAAFIVGMAIVIAASLILIK